MVGAPEQVRVYLYALKCSFKMERGEHSQATTAKLIVSAEDMFADLGATALDGGAAFVGVAGLNIVLIYQGHSYNKSTDFYSWTLWKMQKELYK